MDVSQVGQTLLLTTFGLAAAVWVGGYVALMVVARAAGEALPTGNRILFFRALGRRYTPVGLLALLLALASGAALLRDEPRGALFVTAVVLAAALAVVTAAGIQQARWMTQRRAELARHPEDEDRMAWVWRGGRVATLLRAAIGVLTLALGFTAVLFIR